MCSVLSLCSFKLYVCSLMSRLNKMMVTTFNNQKSLIKQESNNWTSAWRYLWVVGEFDSIQGRYRAEMSVIASWCDMIVEKPTLAFIESATEINYLNIRFVRPLLVFTSYDGKKRRKNTSKQSRSINGIMRFSLV